MRYILLYIKCTHIILISHNIIFEISSEIEQRKNIYLTESYVDPDHLYLILIPQLFSKSSSRELISHILKEVYRHALPDTCQNNIYPVRYRPHQMNRFEEDPRNSEVGTQAELVGTVLVWRHLCCRWTTGFGWNFHNSKLVLQESCTNNDSYWASNPRNFRNLPDSRHNYCQAFRTLQRSGPRQKKISLCFACRWLQGPKGL